MTVVEAIRLADLCDLVSSQVDPNLTPDALYIGLEHLVSGRFIRNGGGIGRDVQSSKYAFREGDILYGKLRPYLNKAIVATEDGVCSTELLVLRPKPDVDPRFLIGVVHSRDFIEHAVSGTTGAQHPRTSWHRIAEFELPPFTPFERSQISALLWLTYEALTTCDKVIEAAQQVKRAAMATLFAHGLRQEQQQETEFGSVPESWRVELLDNCAVVQTGVAKGRKLVDPDMINVPYLRVANVQDGHLDLTEMKMIDIRQSELERYRLQTGDVVLTEGGDFDKLGRGFIWRGELDLCVHQNHIFAVRPKRECLLPEFLAYMAQSAYGKAYFLKVAHKTTNLASINSTKLKEFPVLLPTLDEQREIISILDAIDREIDRGKRKRTVLEGLIKVLLHKLITGEIRTDQLDLSALKPEKAVT